MPSRELDGLRVIERSTVRNHLANVIGIVREQVRDLDAFHISDGQYLPLFQQERRAAAGRYECLVHQRFPWRPLKGHFQSGGTTRPLYWRASLVSPCRLSIGFTEPASCKSR